MRLLNTRTYRLKTFTDSTSFPSYAILSHRWQDGEELPFGDLQDSDSHLLGYKKVKAFCNLAAQSNIDYAWADTCCIDGRSSAELNEAINSMFQWYKNSEVCIVYLSDIHREDDLPKSEWFRRGWTLQELIAPDNVQFFDGDWRLLGEKYHLRLIVNVATGIPIRALRNFQPSEYCLAEKFSWAAKRNTTRVEDRAYCLLGILDVNMTMLYGEGERAFQRLQEEIMRINADMSLFLWQGEPSRTFGLLASDASCYKDGPSSDIGRRWWLPERPDRFVHPNGWTCNNAGIRLKAALYAYGFDYEDGTTLYLLGLSSPSVNSVSKGRHGPGIFVRQTSSTGNEKSTSFRRVLVDGFNWTQIEDCHARLRVLDDHVSDLSIARQPLHRCTACTDLIYRVRVSSSDPMAWSFSSTDPYRPHDWTEYSLGHSTRNNSAGNVHSLDSPMEGSWQVTVAMDSLSFFSCIGTLIIDSEYQGNERTPTKTVIYFGYESRLRLMALVIPGVHIDFLSRLTEPAIRDAMTRLASARDSRIESSNWLPDAGIGIWTQDISTGNLFTDPFFFRTGIFMSSKWDKSFGGHSVSVHVDRNVLLLCERAKNGAHQRRDEARRLVFEHQLAEPRTLAQVEDEVSSKLEAAPKRGTDDSEGGEALFQVVIDSAPEDEDRGALVRKERSNIRDHVPRQPSPWA